VRSTARLSTHPHTQPDRNASSSRASTGTDMIDPLDAVDLALKEALNVPCPPSHDHLWTAMESLSRMLRSRDAVVAAADLLADDDFNGIPQPTFSVGSPGPPPEEAELINVTAHTSASVDDMLGNPAGAAFDLLAPAPLFAAPLLNTEPAHPAVPSDVRPPANEPPAQPDEAAEEPRAVVEAKISAWAERNGQPHNLRALLASLHEVTPEHWGWQPTSLSALVDGAAALKAYQRAALVVHPDKLVNKPAAQQDRGRAIFTALKRAQVEFKRAQ